MTDIAYTPHATHWMRLRHITQREVEAALADPEIRCPGHFGRTVIRTHVRGRLLRIAYELHRGTYLVVSVVAPEEEDRDAAYRTHRRTDHEDLSDARRIVASAVRQASV